MKRITVILALLAAFMVGICFIILGSISIELMNGLHINAGQFGSLVMVLFLTSCIVQLFIGVLVDKVGHKPVAMLGFFATSMGMFILAGTSIFSVSLIACIFLGIGAMSLSTVANTLMPVILFEGKDPARASNFGNGFFALSYILIPLFIVFIIKTLRLGYSTALIILGIFSISSLILTLIASFPKVPTNYKISLAFKLFLKPAVLVAALALFCYVSLEVSMGTWIKKFMEELYKGIGNQNALTNAGLVLSLFGVTLMIGRFLTSTIKNLTNKGSKVIVFTSILSLFAISMMIIIKSPAMGIIAVLLAGLAFAPIAPTILGITFVKFDASLYGSIYGIINTAGLLGGTFVPKIIGNLSVGSTVQKSIPIAALMAFILIAISLFMGRIGSGKNGKDLKNNMMS